jgi:hypothetical protein
MVTTKKPAVVAKVVARAKKVERAAKVTAPAKTIKKKTVAETKAKPKTTAKKTTSPKADPKLKVSASAKAAATKAGEPYVSVVSVELDPNNVQNGAFELDWNEIFVARLVKAGYEGKDDAQIVDQWFQDICRNVIMENFEQWNANQTGENRVVVKRDLGNGRSEIS